MKTSESLQLFPVLPEIYKETRCVFHSWLSVCVSPVFVNDGIEELSVPPAGGEVVTAQALVSLHHPLRPQQQLLFGRHVVRLTVHLDVRYLGGTRCRHHRSFSFLLCICVQFLPSFSKLNQNQEKGKRFFSVIIKLNRWLKGREKLSTFPSHFFQMSHISNLKQLIFGHVTPIKLTVLDRNTNPWKCQWATEPRKFWSECFRRPLATAGLWTESPQESFTAAVSQSCESRRNTPTWMCLFSHYRKLNKPDVRPGFSLSKFQQMCQM